MFSATDLNRRAGEVLNRARRHPVTISRNNEQFALLRREQIGKLVEAVTALIDSVEIIGAALAASKGDEVLPAFRWLHEFDSDDLSTFTSEVVEAINAACRTNEWLSVRDLITQWESSAIASMDGTLDTALASQRDEVSLVDPATVHTETPEPIVS